MQFENLTNAVQQAISAAQALAVKHQHAAIDPEHLAKSLADVADSFWANILKQSSGSYQGFYQDLENTVENLPKLGQPSANVPISQALSQWFYQAERLAQEMGDQFIAVEVLLLAIYQTELNLKHQLIDNGFEHQAVAKVINTIRPKYTCR